MKLSYKKLQVAAAVIAGLAAVWSCSSEINFDDGSFDPTVTVGGDSLAIPVGSTQAIFIEDFMDIEEGGIISKDGEGRYSVNFSQSFETEVDVKEIVSRIHVPELRNSFDESVNIGTAVPDAVSGKYRVEVESLSDPYPFEIDLSDAKEYVSSIDRIEVDGALRFSAVMEGMPAGTEIEVDVTFPEEFIFRNGQKGVVTFEGVADSRGVVDFDVLQLETIALNFDAGSSFVFKDEINLERFAIEMDLDPSTFSGPTGVRFDLELTSVSGGSPKPEAFYGRVRISLDHEDDLYNENNWISLEGIPEFLKSEDVVLDFTSPYIDVALTSNLGVPMVVNAGLTPYFGDDMNMTAGNPLSVSISSPFCINPSAPETVRYWLSDEKEEEVADGYTWVDADVAEFIRRIPDRIYLSYGGYSDVNSAEEHFIDFTEDSYFVDGSFNFVLPFEFGEDLYLPVKDTVTGLPDILSTLLKSANIIVEGNVESTFPVDIILSAYFIDYSGVPVGRLTSSRIKAAMSEDQPEVSPVVLTSDQIAEGSSLDAIVIEFALDGTASGLALSDKSYIRLSDIVLKAPGGVTIDSNNMNF